MYGNDGNDAEEDGILFLKTGQTTLCARLKLRS